jgi:hypothetical protein
MSESSKCSKKIVSVTFSSLFTLLPRIGGRARKRSPWREGRFRVRIARRGCSSRLVPLTVELADPPPRASNGNILSTFLQVAGGTDALRDRAARQPSLLLSFPLTVSQFSDGLDELALQM